MISKQMKAHITLISTLLLLAVSCENKGEETVWDNPNYVRVSVTQEALANDGNDVIVQWFEADSIKMFDTQKRGAVIRTNNYTDGKGAPEVFFSSDWTAGDPFYAVRPATRNTVCTEDGIEGLEIPASQNVTMKNDPGVVPAIGPVTGNRTAYRAVLKNTAGSVIFAMTDSTIASVKIESIGGEPVAGMFDVNFAALENNEVGFWTKHEGSQPSTSVVLTPAEGSKAITVNNTFKNGSFYANVLPQTYSQGLKLTASFLDGKTTEQILTGADGSLTVPRSGVVAAAKAMDETLPDEFEVVLDFTQGWPFKEAIIPAASQSKDTKNLDKYNFEYKYMNGESEFSTNLVFYLYGNQQAYSYTSNQLRTAAKNARITLPGIYGRYIKSVKLEVINSGAKGFNLVSQDWSTTMKGPSATVTNPGVLTIPTASGEKTEKATSYFMQYTAGNTYITSITIKYSVSLD